MALITVVPVSEEEQAKYDEPRFIVLIDGEQTGYPLPKEAAYKKKASLENNQGTIISEITKDR